MFPTLARAFWLSYLRNILTVVMMLSIVQIYAQKMVLRPANEHLKPKQHPSTQLLRSGKPQAHRISAKADYEKLLVILVDFQEEVEDDPLTTGNGKFQLEPDPSYLYSIGAPPHDREYFEANLEAMRYYYLAVSAGSYDLQYDVWPKDKPAYTLPEPMSYYNPPNAPSDIFVQKMEEYFKLAFEIADQEDPEIDFSSYAHYMIIHAGSDWQHDIFGDTPSDIPSFFIRVGDGKQAIVDGGQTEIFHACNVPATISQDFESYQQDGYTIHSGYGALNSVLFHEFGHSLGLVDLYNVRNFYPMVGAFDIMDSGGSGVLMDELENGDMVYVQGILPSLPGAFSRALLFEEDFRRRGLMVDAGELPPNEAISLAASSMLEAGSIPSIIRFPINDTEYFLIENRNLDPDGDGATAVYGDLAGRVVLYPTALNDPNNRPTYEYDYLLPSFMKANGDVAGGGIMVWHVDEKILFEEGVYLSDGSFRSNFDNNSVNTNFQRPGVSVLEADGLRDLGEPDSSYWTGTPYEYFHAFKPTLNTDGLFVNWSLEPWRPSLSSFTKPAMLGRHGLGSLYYLDDISSPSAVMSFSLKSGFFTELFSEQIPGRQSIAMPINTAYSDLSIPFISADGINLYSYMNDEWQNLMGPSILPQSSFDHPVINVDNNSDGYLELAGVKDKKLYFMDFANINLTSRVLSFSEPLGSPLANESDLYVHTVSGIFRIRDYEIAEFAQIEGIKTIAAWGDQIMALRERDFLLLDCLDLGIIETFELPESFGDYEPIAAIKETPTISLMSDSGNLYHYNSFKGELKKIFTNQSEYLPTQIGAYIFDDTGANIFFALGDRAYLLSANGRIRHGFPRYLDQVLADPHQHPKALLIDDEYILLYPVESQGYMALSSSGEPRAQYSLYYHAGTGSFNDFMFYNESDSQLLWCNAQANTSGSRVYIHSLNVDDNPLVWNGYRNGATGEIFIPDDLGASMPGPRIIDAYVFPNPVRSGIFRLRISGNCPGYRIDVYDIAGKRVLSKEYPYPVLNTDIELDSSKLSSGIYIIHISTSVDSKTIKFAVEK